MIEEARKHERTCARTGPVNFDKTAYIRLGSATPPLQQHLQLEQRLWAKISSTVWETGLAAEFLTASEVLNFVDYPKYFELTEQPLPEGREGILKRLADDRLIAEDVGGHWNITNLGAVLFGKELERLNVSLGRKAVRFTHYSGTGRHSEVRSRFEASLGYASVFENLVERIMAAVPSNEAIGQVMRIETPTFPPIAIREVIANALIHQDMTVSGAGPIVELFEDRVEITNPGTPLVEPIRFVDSAPRSRNEMLAALMRRMRMCEEHGTGVDKVLHAVEFYQSPAPDFIALDNAVRVILYAPRSYAEMSKEERIRACYQHAALKYVENQKMNNASLRERLGIAVQNKAQASTVICHTQDAGLIKPADPEHPRTAYVPFWA